MLGALLFGEMVIFKDGILFSIFDLSNTDSARTFTARLVLKNGKRERG